MLGTLLFQPHIPPALLQQIVLKKIKKHNLDSVYIRNNLRMNGKHLSALPKLRQSPCNVYCAKKSNLLSFQTLENFLCTCEIHTYSAMFCPQLVRQKSLPIQQPECAFSFTKIFSPRLSGCDLSTTLPMSEIELKIKKGLETDFNRVYSDMLKQFPASELKSKEAFLNLMGKGRYDFRIVCNPNGNLIAYFTCFIAENENIGLLDHLAVLSRYHSKGYGSHLMGLIRRQYSNLDGLLLEVEKENPQFPDTIRRIKFYERNGAHKLDIRYILPGAGNSATEMNLMFLDCSAKHKEIPKRKIFSALGCIFENLHKPFFANSGEIYGILKKDWESTP